VISKYYSRTVMHYIRSVEELAVKTVARDGNCRIFKGRVFFFSLCHSNAVSMEIKSYLTKLYYILIDLSAYSRYGLLAGHPKLDSWQRQYFIFSTSSRRSLGPNQRPIQRLHIHHLSSGAGTIGQ
jgi:hypothetical protein